MTAWVVHHLDGNPANNAPANLVVLDATVAARPADAATTRQVLLRHRVRDLLLHLADEIERDPQIVVRAADPDYDVTGPLDDIDAYIAYEQRVAGDARALRQTEAWRNRPVRPDPTDILDG